MRAPWLVAVGVVAAVLATAGAAPPLPAPLRTIVWSELQAAGRLTVGKVIPPARPQDPEALQIENETDRPRTFTVALVDTPGIRQADWAITGKVQCIAVEGRAYLEMASYFPNGEVHFAKTLDRAGPTGWLEGNMPWREFGLVFHSFRGQRPSRLTVNVVLPKRGIVEVGPLTLREGKAAAQAALGKH